MIDYDEFQSYYVLKAFACYLAYGDGINLTDEEIEQVDSFLANKTYSHLDYKELDETYFRTCEITGLKGDCMELILVEMNNDKRTDGT
jgi:hypothetical protein